LYLAAILDLHSKIIVGWSMASRMTKKLVLEALEMAVGRRHPGLGLIHHTDRGSRYACGDYQRALRSHGMICSMSARAIAGIMVRHERALFHKVQRCCMRDESMASRNLVAGPGSKPRRAAVIKSHGG